MHKRQASCQDPESHPIFATFVPECITRVEPYDGVAITVPREGTNFRRMEEEFFTTMTRPGLYGK